MSKNSIGLYIHIPFCLSKCPYCDFYSLKADSDSIKKYTAAVINAIKNRPYGGLNVDTVYFGGGTPSIIGAQNLADILQAAKGSFFVADNAEITLEANPCTVDYSFFCELKIAGFNRLSMGLQSANDEQLKILGRRHNADEAKAAVLAAQRAGFDNISLDIMLGIPQQTMEIVENSINFCAELNVSHISAYMLKIEPNTPFYKSNIAEICPDEDTQADLYLHAVSCLESRGYMQYEISNFARDGKKSRHNLKYWHCEEYLGIGPSAHSFLGGRRFYFERDINKFVGSANPFDNIIDDGEGGGAEEYIMMSLRLTEGLNLKTLEQKYASPQGIILKKAKPLIKAGLAIINGDSLSLTPSGFLISNSIIAELINYK